MARAAILVVDEPGADLVHVRGELHDRYGRHYELLAEGSADDARTRLEALAAAGVEVALVLVGHWLPGEPGAPVLESAHELHPHARRAGLVGWADWGTPEMGRAIFDGIADGRLDHYVLRPAASPDERFHQTVSMVLLEWAESNRAAPYTVRIVGESWSGRAYELREALQACAVPHDFCLADSPQGRQLTAAAPPGARLPLVLFPDGRVLQDPTNLEISQSTGGPVDPQRAHFDVVIVGAGPAGLSAAVYGASEGLSTLVVDQGGIGGQATSSSLIRNYLGFPHGISGRRLAQDAYSQGWVFGAEFVFMQQVTGIAREGDHFLVSLSDIRSVRASAVLLATGVSYRRLGVPGLEALLGAGVFYGGSTSEAPALADREVYVVGGANSAGQAALHLAQYARRVTVVVRTESLRDGMSEYLVRQVERTGNIRVRLGSEVVGGGGEGRLGHVVLRDRSSGVEDTEQAHALFILIGAEPRTGWLPAEIEQDEHGFVLTGADVSPERWAGRGRGPYLLETSEPGVFAAGDVRRGSVKRVASAVGEGSIAIQALHGYLGDLRAEPGRPRGGLPAAVV